MLITQRNITISDMPGPMSETTLHINSFSEVSEKYWKVPHDDTLTLMFRNIYNYSHFKHNIDQGRERRGYYFCIEFHWYSNIVLYVQLKCPGSVIHIFSSPKLIKSVPPQSWSCIRIMTCKSNNIRDVQFKLQSIWHAIVICNLIKCMYWKKSLI